MKVKNKTSVYDNLKGKGAVEVGSVSEMALNKTVKAILADDEKNKNFHLEAFTAAYYSMTKIPPTDAVMCEVKLGDSVVYFFDTKDNLFEQLTEALALQVEEEIKNEPARVESEQSS